MKKRLLSMLLVLVMMLGILPVTAMADNEAPWELGDTFESDNPEATLPTDIPEGTKWSGPVVKKGDLICDYPDSTHEHTEACYELDCTHTHTDNCYPWVWVKCTNEDHYRNGRHKFNTGCEYNWDRLEWGSWQRDKNNPTYCSHSHTEACYKLTCEEHVHTDDCYEKTYVWTLVDFNQNTDDWRGWWPVYWGFDKNSVVTDASVVAVTAGTNTVKYTGSRVGGDDALKDSTANAGMAIAGNFNITTAPGYYVTRYRLVCGNYITNPGCGIVGYNAGTPTGNTDGDYTSVISIDVDGDDFDHDYDLPYDYPVDKPSSSKGNLMYDRNNTIYPFYLMVEVARDTATYSVSYTWGDLRDELSQIAPPETENNLLRGSSHTVQNPSEAAIVAARSAGYEFAGWSVSGTGYDDDIVAPDAKVAIRGSNLLLTAKWRPVPTYTVSYAWGTGVTAPEGAVLPASQTFSENAVVATTDLRALPEADDYTITGWYTDAACTVPVTEFTITKDVTLYAKAEISTAAYTVKYYKDTVSPENYLGEESGTKEIGRLVTVDKTKYAPAGYAVPGTADKDSITITADASSNVATVVYSKRTDLSYTVNYLEKDTNKVLAAPKTEGNQTFDATVTENAIDIEGYNKVDPTSKTITIAVSGNEINFYYTARTDLSYTVNYYLEGTTTSVAPPKTVDGQTFGASVTEHAKEIEDYILVGEATKTITIAVSGNVINFFYKFDAKPGLKVEKDVYAINNKLVDANKAYTVNVNDVVTWKITVANEGNVALRGVSVEDTLTIGKTSVALKLYDADGNQVTSLYLAAKGEDGAVKVLYASYKVTAKDQGYKLANTVVADAGDNGPKDSDTNDDFKVKDAIVYVPTLNKKDHVAYIIGYEDDTVRPENNITRAEVATIFFRLLTDDSRARYWSKTNDFSDVSSRDWFNNAVSTMANAGILTGYPDGTFKPNAPITRAEFAAIAARFSDVSYNGSCSFTDVAKTHWAADEIALAEHLGWITGYPDDTFRPGRNITRAEAMTLINRVLERAVEEDHMHKDMVKWIDNSPSAWYYEAVQEATNSHTYTRLSKKVPGQSFCYEDWTGILKAPDWAALEKSWSDANDR